MNPLNKEYLEAEQAATDKKRNDFIASLPEEDKKKFQAVEKAVEILVEADVLFYLFPYLPTEEPRGKNQVWQWNSMNVNLHTKPGEDDKISDEALNYNRQFHQSFYSQMFQKLSTILKGNTFSEKLSDLPYFIYFCCQEHNKYMEDIPKID